MTPHLLRACAIASIYETFARGCDLDIKSGKFEQIAQIAYQAITQDVEFFPTEVRIPHLVRLVGQSGSGKTTQLYEAVKNNIAHGFVHVAVRHFARFHPEYEQIKNKFGENLLREKTNGFALLLLFRVLEKLIDNNYSILLELTVLDPRFELYLAQLFEQKYRTLYNVLAVPKELSDEFIMKRQQQSGRVVTQTSSEYFFDMLNQSLRQVAYCEQAVLWNAYSFENIAQTKVFDDKFFAKLSLEQSKAKDDVPRVDEAQLLLAKKAFYDKQIYFSQKKDNFLEILAENCDLFKHSSSSRNIRISAPLEVDSEELQKSITLTPINTGWTNVVFDVEFNTHYIARFPRGACFARAMKTDIAAINFVKNVVPTPDVKIYFDGLRPFSVHKKIDGIVLSSIDLEELEELEATDSLGRQIATFFTKIHNLVPPKYLQRKLSTFLQDVLSEIPFYEDYSAIEQLAHAENNNTVVAVHGDLNVGNIIVDEHFNILSFLDFAFFGVSIPEADLARINRRIPTALFNAILVHYKRLSGRRIDQAQLTRMIEMWDNIERNYIKFMAQTMPEIEV
jgi:aminoglycoside phosphotransferase (APT) family kinase protein